MCHCSGGKECATCKARIEREKASKTNVNISLAELIVACCEQGTSSPLYDEAKNEVERHKEQVAQNNSKFEYSRRRNFGL